MGRETAQEEEEMKKNLSYLFKRTWELESEESNSELVSLTLSFEPCGRPNI